MSTPKCQFLHAFYEDDWTRCPHPEQVREYRLKDGSTAWYCDEGAEEAWEVLAREVGGTHDR